MKKVILPNGDVLTLEEYAEVLANDKIKLVELDPEMEKELNEYFELDFKKRIVGKRFKSIKDMYKYFNYSLKNIIDKKFIERHLPDVKKATNLLLEKIKHNERIIIVSDMDTDGITSAAILYKMFKELLEYDNIDVVVNRRNFGHGINKQLTNLLIDMYKKDPFSLVITSDHGSHDVENLKRLKKELGIQIIVTDHHLFEEHEAPYEIGPFVNPKRNNKSNFYNITGTAVAYFTLLHTFFKLNKDKEVPIEKLNYIYYLLTYVGLTIVSDCVPLNDPINRKLLIKALNIINNRHIEHDIFWKYIMETLSEYYVIDETTLGFNVIPILNSPGRVGNPYDSFRLLISESPEEFFNTHEKVTSTNTKRKELQLKAITTDKKTVLSNGIVKVIHIENSDGIQGIIANNIMNDENLKVVVVFSSHKEDNKTIFVGSGRSNGDGVNIIDVLKEMEKDNEGGIINFGGHASAVGVKIEPDIQKFYKALVKYVEKTKVKKQETVYVEDIIYSFRQLLIDIFSTIELSPYGIEFPPPIFVSDFRVASYKIYKTAKGNFLSMKVLFVKNNTLINVFYPIKAYELVELEEKLKTKKYVRLTYTFNINTYRNFNRIQLLPTSMKFY